MEICDTCKEIGGYHSPNCIRKRYGLPSRQMQHKCRLRLKHVSQHIYTFTCLGGHEVRMNKFAVRRAVLGTSRL